MRFYTTSRLGPHREKTPEGYLICYAVPIARTGLQTYSEREPPFDQMLASGKITSSGDGYIRVERLPEDVFSPETVASFEGKDVVDDHPEDDVGPGNYQDLSRGVVTNVRRGEGAEDDLMLADLIIKEARAIRAALDGKVQVSCGYNADYETIGPGHARQYNILGNHVALVDTARCGGRCAIQDGFSAGRRGVRRMARFSFKDALRRAYRAKDAEELAEIEREGEEAGLGEEHGGSPGERGAEMDDAVHVHLHGGGGHHMDARHTLRDGLDDPDGDEELDEQILTRIEAMERDHEEMKAQLEEVIDCLEEGGDVEDTRRRLSDMRRRMDDRRRDDARGRGDDARRRDAGRRHEMDDIRRSVADARRAHDADPDRESPEWREEEEDIKKAEDALRREDCDVMDARRHRDRMRHHDARRRARDAEGNKEIEGNLEMEAPPGTADRARRARDSAFLEDSFQETVATSEIIAPGMRTPTFDRAARPRSTFDAICDLRRRTLDEAYRDPDLHRLMDAAVGNWGERSRTLDCAATRVLFRTVGAVCRDRNNAAAPMGVFTATHGSGGGSGVIGSIKTPAELQKEIDKFWANQGVKV